jgi:hypothetical protein
MKIKNILKKLGGSSPNPKRGTRNTFLQTRNAYDDFRAPLRTSEDLTRLRRSGAKFVRR